MKPISFRRILPVVVVVGGVLLAIKGEGLVRTALAEGLEAISGDTSILAEDTAPLAASDVGDAAGGDSAGKNDVISAMGKRREELDAREAEIENRMQLVSAAEKRVDAKIDTLKQLQDQIAQMLGQRDQEEQKTVTALVKTYSSMKPKDAARIFNNLSDAVLIPVAAAMKPDVLAPVMANMNSDAAQRLTVSLANRLKLPASAAPASAVQDALICNPQTPIPANAGASAPAGGASPAAKPAATKG